MNEIDDMVERINKSRINNWFDPYVIFDLPYESKSSEIKSKYFELIKRFHPDGHRKAKPEDILKLNMIIKWIEDSFSEFKAIGVIRSKSSIK